MPGRSQSQTFSPLLWHGLLTVTLSRDSCSGETFGRPVGGVGRPAPNRVGRPAPNRAYVQRLVEAQEWD